MDQITRNTFCQCSECNHFFRQSDTVTYDDVRPTLDFLDKLNREITKLEIREDIMRTKLIKVKQDATLAGRIAADEHIAEYDTIFKPLGYSPNDVKVQFHPIDFVVFNGMNDPTNPTIKNIVLLDSKKENDPIQESIRQCVENEKYKFITIKIKSDGTVIEE
jgi:predicted Holliday junction resolvase-like endonuclease